MNTPSRCHSEEGVCGRKVKPRPLVAVCSCLAFVFLAASLFAAEPPKGDVERPDPPANTERLEKARQTVVQMFQKNFDKATNPAKKQELAQELFANAPRIKDDMEVRYAMLLEARDQAIAAEKTALALEAIDLTAKYFRVDPIEMKIAALEQLSKSVRDPVGRRDMTATALDLSKTAADENRFDDADRLAMLGMVSARKLHSPQLIRQANERMLEIMAAKKKAKTK
jgi:hypothetical protein